MKPKLNENSAHFKQQRIGLHRHGSSRKESDVNVKTMLYPQQNMYLTRKIAQCTNPLKKNVNSTR